MTWDRSLTCDHGRREQASTVNDVHLAISTNVALHISARVKSHAAVGVYRRLAWNTAANTARDDLRLMSATRGRQYGARYLASPLFELRGLIRCGLELIFFASSCILADTSDRELCTVVYHTHHHHHSLFEGVQGALQNWLHAEHTSALIKTCSGSAKPHITTHEHAYQTTRLRYAVTSSYPRVAGSVHDRLVSDGEDGGGHKTVAAIVE